MKGSLSAAFFILINIYSKEFDYQKKTISFDPNKAIS